MFCFIAINKHLGLHFEFVWLTHKPLKYIKVLTVTIQNQFIYLFVVAIKTFYSYWMFFLCSSKMFMKNVYSLQFHSYYLLLNLEENSLHKPPWRSQLFCATSNVLRKKIEARELNKEFQQGEQSEIVSNIIIRQYDIIVQLAACNCSWSCFSQLLVQLEPALTALTDTCCPLYFVT